MTIKLSIAIPTFNNANILNEWFVQHQTLLTKYNIPVYISDNYSSDETPSVIQNWKKKFKQINYCPTKTVLKAEANFERAINLPQTGWVWLIGDSYLIDISSIDKVMSTLKTKDNYGFCIININNRIKEPSNYNLNYNLALERLSGVVSCISCNIYNLDFHKRVEFPDKDKSYFPHLSFFFNKILKGVNFYWINDAGVKMLRTKKRRTNWANTPKVWEIGIDNWHDCINELKGYSNRSKLIAWTEFGRVSGLLSVRGLFWLRAQGLLSNKILNNNILVLKRVLGNNYIFMRIIMSLPILPLKLIMRIIGYK